MLASSQSSFVIVAVPSPDVDAFRASYPCSGIPAHSSFRFEFDRCNGDLVNITMYGEYGEYLDSNAFDGSGLLSLSQDAELFAIQSGHLPQWIKTAKGY